MNSIIETLNQWGGRFADFAWPMLWQSSLLIVILFAVEFLLRRRIRTSIRYAFWLVVLVKLCLPPTLASPTSPVWWLPRTQPPAVPPVHYTVTYGTRPLPEISQNPAPVYAAPEPAMTRAAWLLLASGFVSVLLSVMLSARWRHIAKLVRSAKFSERLTAMLNETRQLAGVKSTSPVRLAQNATSPAICGLFRPAILIPQSLAEKFSDEQLRAVLLHEMVHLRRRDVWLNCLQALLQIAYWWHPLLWLANARIRHVREEAVDDAVMLALQDKSETYAPTLLEVAKLALNRPLASLGLVGILESRSALQQRIERLVNFSAPRKAGLTFASLLGICIFSAVALPMGQAPTSAPDEFSAAATSAEKTLKLKVNPKIFLRNIKAKANWTLDAPTDSWTKILLDLMRCETVDCSPPHGIAFNTKTGEITTQNTPEKLKIFRQVIEQLNRPDGLFEMPDIPRRKVLIEARYFWMSSDDRKKLVADLPSEYGGNESAPLWIISPEQFNEVDQRIAALNLHPFQRPRIQTGDGLGAEFRVGNKPNGVDFDCLPYEADKGLSNGYKGVALVFRTETIGNPTGPGQELVGTNQYRASGKVGVEDRGGFIVSTGNPEGSPSNVVMVIRVETVTNISPTHFQQQSQTIMKPGPVDVATRVGSLVADGKLFYEMGRFDEAERKLRSALARKPGDQAADYYMNLVQAAKTAQREGIVQTQAGRRRILDELTRVRFDHFGPYDQPLGQVLDELKPLTGGLLSEKSGIQFFVVENSDSGKPVTNPTNGLPLKNARAKGADLNSVLVYIPPLKNATLGEVLDAIVWGASKPIQYSVSDGVIVFSPKDNFQVPQLFTRTFKVNTNIFLANLKKQAGLGTNVAVALRRLLLTSGVCLTPPESIFYNVNLGLLLVRATERDLDVVENTIARLNSTPQEIHIKARFIEVPGRVAAAVYLGSFNANNHLAPDNIPQPDRNTLNQPKFMVTATEPASFAGIMTESQLHTALHTLRGNTGFEELAVPQVTTISGRQTQMRATRSITVVTNFGFLEKSHVSAVFPQTNAVETGPVLNMVATALPDGHTIDLAAIASLTKFLGYDNTTNATVVYNKEGEKVNLPTISPSFDIRKASAHVKLWDGQTLVLGLKNHFYDAGKEVGAEPDYFVKAARNRGWPSEEDKKVLVFITVTLVDPAGNRIHSDSGENAVPPQSDP